MLFVAVAANVVALAALPYLGRLSDRVGRRAVFVSGALASIPGMFLYLRAIESGNYWFITLAGIALNGLIYSAANAVWPSFYAEMFSTRVRYSGMAIGTQIGFGLAGFGPTLAEWIAGEGPRGWVPAAWLVAGCCVLAAACALTARETADIQLEDLGRRDAFPAPEGSPR
jgi:MFS family permease